MKVIETYSPIYHVELNHPDTGSEFHRVFIDDEGEAPSIFADEEVWNDYTKQMLKKIWEKFNSSGYWHTMTVHSEQVVDGKVYTPTICEDYGICEYMS